jgi:ADP-heptose:LPS heptosyltransferase
MQRFDNQPLRERPHLAVLFQDKLGGFVVTTPLLRGLKQKYPEATVDYFGGERTVELESACPYIDQRYSLYGNPDALRGLPDYLAEREAEAGPYDLAINLDFNPLNAVVTTMLRPTFVIGRCFQADGRRELPLGSSPTADLQDPATFWAGEDFLPRFSGVLQSNFIGEIYCRLARVETDFQRTEVPIAPPPLAVPDILVATGGTRTAKLWSTSSWIRLIDSLHRSALTVGLLGAAPSVQKTAYGSADTEAQILGATSLVDLRGKLTLPEVAGALAAARGCVAIDNGVMHLAAAVGTPTVAVFGASAWELWAPKVPWLHLALPRVACSLCRDNRYLNDGCLREQHVCMESISPDDVSDLVRSSIRPSSRPCAP